MEQITRIGMDTSKQIFQLHGVDASERAVLRRPLKRRDVLRFFKGLSPVVVGIEACAASHYWSRELTKLGHEVLLLPPQYVKAYVKRGKHDAADAEAICEAMSRPSMRTVPTKTAEQQAALMLVSVRDQLVRTRTRMSNAIRGHAAEFGLVSPRGLDKIEPLLAAIAADQTLPELARDMFAEMGKAYEALNARLDRITAELVSWQRNNPVSRRLAKVPGIGPIGSAMLAMKVPDPHRFNSARHFAAWLGLTPKNHSTAGKQRLGVITRAGDEAMRSVLVVGATAILQRVRVGKGPAWPWLVEMLKKKPPKLVAVALANKMARIAWKLMVSGEDYSPARALALISDPQQPAEVAA